VVPLAPTVIVCVVVADALSSPVAGRRRLEQVATTQGVTLAGSAAETFLILRGDPARSVTEPPPLVCRATREERPFLAPLLRLAQGPAILHILEGADVLAGVKGLSGLPGVQLRVLLDAGGAVAATAVVVPSPGAAPSGSGGM